MARHGRPVLDRHLIAGAVAFKQHVLVARCDQDVAAQDRIAVLGLLDLDLAQAVEPFGEGGGEARRHVLDDDDAGRIGRQRLQHLAQRLGPACRGAQTGHHLRRARHGGPGRGRQHGVSRQLGSGIQRSRRRSPCAQPGARRSLDHIADAIRALGQMVRRPDARLQYDVDRAGLQRLHQGLGSGLGQGRAHDHRDRPLGHQLAQEGDAVHARHLDVQGDDVGHVLGDATRGDEGVGGHAHDLDAGVGGQDVDQSLAHTGRVVDDQNADLGHGIRSFGKWCWRQSPEAVRCR